MSSCTSAPTCVFMSCTVTFYLTSNSVAQCPDHCMTCRLSVWQCSACSRYNKMQLAVRHVWGSCVIASLILDLCSRSPSVVSFTYNPLTPGHAAPRVRVNSTAGLYALLGIIPCRISDMIYTLSLNLPVYFDGFVTSWGEGCAK